MKTINKMARIGASATLLTLLGCGREAGPSGVRQPPDAATAAAAPSQLPSSAATTAAESASGLRPATAQELRAAIKASGRKATLLNAWASWCGPCRREVPMLQALSVNLKPQGVEVVLVTVDDPKDEAKAASFLKDNGITLKSYIVDGSLADFKAGINPRWPGMLPASFLFGADGELVHFWAGEAFENEIVPVVEDFLGGRAIQPETRYGLAPGKTE